MASSCPSICTMSGARMHAAPAARRSGCRGRPGLRGDDIQPVDVHARLVRDRRGTRPDGAVGGDRDVIHAPPAEVLPPRGAVKGEHAWTGSLGRCRCLQPGRGRRGVQVHPGSVLERDPQRARLVDRQAGLVTLAAHELQDAVGLAIGRPRAAGPAGEEEPICAGRQCLLAGTEVDPRRPLRADRQRSRVQVRALGKRRVHDPGAAIEAEDPMRPPGALDVMVAVGEPDRPVRPDVHVRPVGEVASLQLRVVGRRHDRPARVIMPGHPGPRPILHRPRDPDGAVRAGLHGLHVVRLVDRPLARTPRDRGAVVGREPAILVIRPFPGPDHPVGVDGHVEPVARPDVDGVVAGPGQAQQAEPVSGTVERLLECPDGAVAAGPHAAELHPGEIVPGAVVQDADDPRLHLLGDHAREKRLGRHG